MVVVTKPFNITVSYFDAKKSVCCKLGPSVNGKAKAMIKICIGLQSIDLNGLFQSIGCFINIDKLCIFPLMVIFAQPSHVCVRYNFPSYLEHIKKFG